MVTGGCKSICQHLHRLVQSLCQIDAMRLAAFVTSDKVEQRTEPICFILIGNNRTETLFLDGKDVLDPRMQASPRMRETTVHIILLIWVF